MSLTNRSNKAIKNVEIGFLAWDANGLPIKIKHSYSFGNESFEFVGFGENINVVAGATWGDNYGWNLDQTHSIKTLKANVKTVEFYGGDTWTNPLYNSWLTQYKEKPLF